MMTSQFDFLRELQGGCVLKEQQQQHAALDFYAQVHALLNPSSQASLYGEEDLDSSGISSSDTTVTFGQTPSVGGESSSLLDICTPPPSPYSQTSPHARFVPDGVENEASSAAVPVCYDFVQGRCARSNCRYLHDFQKIEKPAADKRGICFDYLRGDCNRGAMCRFSHEVSNFAQEYKIEDDISLAKVKRWGQGICFDFVRGACSRGEKCPWSHNLLEIAVATKKGIENMETSERNQIAETVRRRLCASLENKGQVQQQPQQLQQQQQDMMMITSPLQSIPSPFNSSIGSFSTTAAALENAIAAASPDWVSLWNYPASVFGPLDVLGRPLHWFAENSSSSNIMNTQSQTS